MLHTVRHSGEVPLLAPCSTCSKPGVGRGCLSGSCAVVADDRRDDAREEASLEILDPGGLVSVRLKTPEISFSLLLLQLTLVSWVK